MSTRRPGETPGPSYDFPARDPHSCWPNRGGESVRTESGWRRPHWPRHWRVAQVLSLSTSHIPTAVPGRLVKAVQLSARIVDRPVFCACCGASPANEEIAATFTRYQGVRIVRSDTRGWRFPFCSSCAAHHNQYYLLDGREATFRRRKVGWIWASIFLCVYVFPIVMVVVNSRRRRRTSLEKEHLMASIQHPCAAIADAVIFDGWNGSVQMFRFANHEYADAFKQANANKLLVR